MIGRLKGILIQKNPPQLLIDVQGVGYEVEAPMSTFFDLPGNGEEIILVTHLVVREDAHILYGFGSEAERKLFRALIKVNKIGAKMALAILSGMSVNDFTRCVELEDATTLSKIPGIGKKTAERLIIEMRDKLHDAAAGLPAARSRGAVSLPTGGDAKSEAVAALVALGYNPAEATSMVKAIDADLSVEMIIKQALQGALK